MLEPLPCVLHLPLHLFSPEQSADQGAAAALRELGGLPSTVT